MHELRIAEDMASIVLEAAKENNLNKVTRVNLSFGVLVQIVPEIFETAFREAVRDTLAHDAGVSLEIIPVKIRCRICGNLYNMEAAGFKCGSCGSADFDIVNGKELFIKSIEGE